MRDEAFTRNLIWKNSSTLVSAERGDLENDFIEITEDEASQLMEELRARWTGTEQRLATCRASLHPLECSSQLARCSVSSLA